MGKYKTYLDISFSGNKAKRRSLPCSNLLNSSSIRNFMECYSGLIEPLILVASGFTTPMNIIFDNSDNMYITTVKTNQIYKIDKQNNVTLFISSTLDLPIINVFDKNCEYMYINNFGNNTISIINMQTLSVETLTLVYDPDLFPTGYPLDEPNGMCFDTTFENLYVTNVGINTNNIVKINISTLECSVFVSDILSPVLITTDNNTPCNFYVTCLVQSVIYKIDYYGNKTLFSSSPLLFGPRAISFNIDYTKLYVTNSQSNNGMFDNIVVFDLNGNILYKYNNAELDEPRALTFNKDYLYIANFGNGIIYKLSNKFI